MAGSNSAFPSADFRTAIRNAAIMAAPNNAVFTPTLRWDEVLTFDAAHADSAGRPYDFNHVDTPVTDTVITDLVIPQIVAVVEKVVEPAEGTRVGLFRGSRCTLTIVDTDYKAILAHSNGRFPDAVIVGPTEYRLEELPKPDTLFDVDVYTVHFFAQSIGEP